MSVGAWNTDQPVLGIGLMSGTSADGIDAAAVELWREDGRVRIEMRAFETLPYPPDVREQLFRCFEDRATVREVCLLNARLGHLFADAAENVLTAARSALPLSFITSHGQTVWHEPGAAVRVQGSGFRVQGSGSGASGGSSPTPNTQHPTPNRGTLQIGEAAVMAERLRVPVVSDFRQQDFALGGQGAPLVPYLDYLLLSDLRENRAVQNLGGIGNVTYLRAGGAAEEVIAFDTGPANALIDAAAALVSDGRLTCDRDGLLAASAPVNQGLLAELMKEPYLEQPPPKSTGRELFSAARVRELWERGHRGPELISTLTQFTVQTIADAYRRWLGPVDAVVLAGGGARNPELVRRLAAALAPARVLTQDELGIDSEAKEAIAFALFGYETLSGRPSNVPSATGASRPAVQGKICWP